MADMTNSFIVITEKVVTGANIICRNLNYPKKNNSRMLQI